MVKELPKKEDIKNPQEKTVRYFRRRFFPFIGTFDTRETLAGKNYAGFFHVVLREDGKAFVIEPIKLKEKQSSTH